MGALQSLEMNPREGRPGEGRMAEGSVSVFSTRASLGVSMIIPQSQEMGSPRIDELLRRAFFRRCLGRRRPSEQNKSKNKPQCPQPQSTVGELRVSHRRSPQAEMSKSAAGSC